MQVCVQLPASAENVALPAFAAAQLLLTDGRAAVDRCRLPTAANPLQRRAAAGWDGRTD